MAVRFLSAVPHCHLLGVLPPWHSSSILSHHPHRSEAGRIEAWIDPVELAGDEPMTAKIVREAAAKHKAGNNGKPKAPKSTPAKRGDLGTALELCSLAENIVCLVKDFLSTRTSAPHQES